MADRVYFNAKVANVTKRTLGLMIGKHLVVASDELNGGYKIHRVDTGEQLLPKAFASVDDAVAFGEWANEIYGEFFDLWEVFPEADIFSLAMWSVKNGLTYHNLIETIKKVKGKINSEHVDYLVSSE
jgi:hypothetical protein